MSGHNNKYEATIPISDSAIDTVRGTAKEEATRVYRPATGLYSGYRPRVTDRLAANAAVVRSRHKTTEEADT